MPYEIGLHRLYQLFEVNELRMKHLQGIVLLLANKQA